MAKGVFTTKLSPAYDDLPEVQYHFPRTYLRQVEQTLGDSIVYYEPRRGTAEANSRGGRQIYFAIARPQTITQDPRNTDLFYCHLSDYLDFDHAVPFREGEAYRESILQKSDGSTNKGAFGRSVRIIPDEEFQDILTLGLSGAPEAINVSGSPNAPFMGVEELVIPFERPMIELTTIRPYRDLAFRRTVRAAYGNRCAVTGLHLINGGGRPEVQAAHIRPVAAQGPDSVRNGLALSGTIHWLFDRGLLSVADDMTVLTAKGHLPDAVHGLINPSGRLNLPTDQTKWPHPAFLRFHRENYFKG
ncbi:restriction endonuclease [bacterium]|nr:MAG: restriction endonuclease [bacterium]